MPNRSDPEKRMTIYSSAAAAVCVCACGAVCCALILLSGLISYMTAGAACALFGAALFLAVRCFLKRSIRDFRMPLAHLRDSAVRIARGELDVRADENEDPYSEIGEVGKVDAGGGGTVALYVAGLDIDVVDLGVPVLSMHAPYEVTSKFDVYTAFKAYKLFYKS